MTATSIHTNRTRRINERLGAAGTAFIHIKAVAAVETPLDDASIADDRRHGINNGIQAAEIEWCVLPPGGITDYEVTIYRWVAMRKGQNGNDVVDGRWVQEEVMGSLTAPLFQLQYTDGLIVGLAITGATGTPTPGEVWQVGVRTLSKRS